MHYQYGRVHISSYFKYVPINYLPPAMITRAGVVDCTAIKIFYDANGYVHRAKGPAMIWHTGVREYLWHGLPHRIGKPWKSNGDTYACYGLLHRLDGPARGKGSYYVGGLPVKKAALQKLKPTDSFSVQSRRGDPLLINLKDGVIHCQDEAAIEWLNQPDLILFAIKGSYLSFEDYLNDKRVLDVDKVFLKSKYS